MTFACERCGGVFAYRPVTEIKVGTRQLTGKWCIRCAAELKKELSK